MQPRCRSLSLSNAACASTRPTNPDVPSVKPRAMQRCRLIVIVLKRAAMRFAQTCKSGGRLVDGRHGEYWYPMIQCASFSTNKANGIGTKANTTAYFGQL